MSIRVVRGVVRRVAPPVFLCVFPSTLVAQAIVHPAHYTRAEAAWSNQLPFGWASVPIRMQQIHAGVPAATIRGIGFRLDARETSDVPAYQVVVEVQMSTALTTPAAPSATFDANHGTDRVTVLPSTVVNLPAVTHGLAPRPFGHVIAFPTPFVHAGTLPLCWDMRIANRSLSSNYDYDHVQTATNPAPTVLEFGTGCRLFGATSAMTLAASGTTDWFARSAVFRFSGARLPVSSLVMLSTGTSNTNLSGAPLPFVLPGTESAPSGPCTIFNDSLLQIPVFTTASGTLAAGTNLTFGLHPSMNGASLYSQVVAVDTRANAWGITTSNSVQMHLSAPYTNNAVSRIYVNGNLTPTGTVQVGLGAVVQFQR